MVSKSGIDVKCGDVFRRNRGSVILGLLLCAGAYYVIHQKQLENEEIIRRLERAKPALPPEIYSDITRLRWKITQQKLKARVLEKEMISIRKIILKKELEEIKSKLELLEQQDKAALTMPDIGNFLPHLRSGSSSSSTSFKPKIYISRQHRQNYTLAFGITVNSVTRVNILLETLKLLIESLDKNDEYSVLFIVYVNVPKYEDNIIERIKEVCGAQISTGLIEIIVPPDNYYPPNLGTELSAPDEYTKVSFDENGIEDARQVLDHSYVMMAAQTKALFYVQLDDDVIVKPNYARKIQNAAFRMSTLTSGDNYWFEVSFSTLPCVGKLYRTSDIEKLSTFYLMYYKFKPCDELVSGLIAAVSCSMENNTCSQIFKKQRTQYRPPLFVKRTAKPSDRYLLRQTN